jgi:signal transduction histidine kinase
VNHLNVLIVAQDPAAARDLVSRWQAEPIVPSFTLLSTDFPRIDGLGPFDLAIIQAEEAESRSWRQAVDSMAETVLLIAQRSHNGAARRDVFVPRTGDWLNTTILVGTEMLARVEWMRRFRKLEMSATDAGRQATLGQYMLDTRHAFNNALTSVLGNAELMMLNVDALPSESREQVETIHEMALKLYEMMQRFASLEAEMRVDERENVRPAPRLAAYGS